MLMAFKVPKVADLIVYLFSINLGIFIFKENEIFYRGVIPLLYYLILIIRLIYYNMAQKKMQAGVLLGTVLQCVEAVQVT